MENKELVKGTLAIIILRLLDGNKKMYGYEITQSVKEITGNKLTIGESALYPALHKLELQGFLISEEEYIGNRLRKYYSLSKSGKIESKKRVKDLQSYLSIIQSIIQLNIAFEK